MTIYRTDYRYDNTPDDDDVELGVESPQGNFTRQGLAGMATDHWWGDYYMFVGDPMVDDYVYAFGHSGDDRYYWTVWRIT